MTDDEIDAILLATPSILSCRTPDEATRAVFIAGMLKAAQIAREREDSLWTERYQSNVSSPDGNYGEGLSDGAGDAAAAIVRAAGGEG